MRGRLVKLVGSGDLGLVLGGFAVAGPCQRRGRDRTGVAGVPVLRHLAGTGTRAARPCACAALGYGVLRTGGARTLPDRPDPGRVWREVAGLAGLVHRNARCARTDRHARAAALAAHVRRADGISGRPP